MIMSTCRSCCLALAVLALVAGTTPAVAQSDFPVWEPEVFVEWMCTPAAQNAGPGSDLFSIGACGCTFPGACADRAPSGCKCDGLCVALPSLPGCCPDAGVCLLPDVIGAVQGLLRDPPVSEGAPAFPPTSTDPQCLHRGYREERNVYWGDTHIHTRYSMDARTQETLLFPDDAYRFALGERVDLRPYDAQGALRQWQLARPLDFVAVSDHAEFLGEVQMCEHPQQGPRSSFGEDNGAVECILFRDQPDQAFLFFNLLLSIEPGNLPGRERRGFRYPMCGIGGGECVQKSAVLWQDIVEAAEAFDTPCEFTAFPAYEWSGSPSTRNLHRNVIFRNGEVPAIPASYIEHPTPEQLWDELEFECLLNEDLPGCDVLTIPHNSNLSSGILFDRTDSEGNPFTPEYALRRAAFEPLVEIFQHKGDSECFQNEGPGANDELCAFEKFPYNNLIADRFGGFLTAEPKERDFVRNALVRGIGIEDELATEGANPFKYGIIASTDTHQGAPGAVVEDGKFPGHGGAGPASRGTLPVGMRDSPAFNPGGLAAVWATENTRDAIFDAMRRRETYGTSGPRMRVRFYGGWEMLPGMCRVNEKRFVSSGDRHGVPMGGDLPAMPASGARPDFAVLAYADPGAPAIGPDPAFRADGDDLGAFGEPSVPLERIQIVKGWIDADGNPQERVVTLLGAEGNPVDPDTCEFSTAGLDSPSCIFWEDDEFDADQPAFYYARVVQNETCRWSMLQCNQAEAEAGTDLDGDGDLDGIDCDDPDAVPEEWAGCCTQFNRPIRERAWTSPVWYKPAS